MHYGGNPVKARPVPPLLAHIVQTALQSCEGVRFHPGGRCSACGGTLSGYDERKKRFAVLIGDDMPHPVHVIIRRSYCRTCRRVSVPHGPFYPVPGSGPRSSTSAGPCPYPFPPPGSRPPSPPWASRSIAGAHGITRSLPLPDCPAVDLFGMRIPVSIISLSTLTGSAHDPEHPGMEDVLAACRYPSRPRAARGPMPGGNGAGGS